MAGQNLLYLLLYLFHLLAHFNELFFSNKANGSLHCLVFVVPIVK